QFLVELSLQVAERPGCLAVLHLVCPHRQADHEHGGQRRETEPSSHGVSSLGMNECPATRRRSPPSITSLHKPRRTGATGITALFVVVRRANGCVSERETASPARSARSQASSHSGGIPCRAGRLPLGFRVRSPLRSLTPGRNASLWSHRPSN